MTSQTLAPAEATLLWREAYEQNLRSDWGWLTVTGLIWIGEGVHRFGSAEDSEIPLAPGSSEAGSEVAPLAGTITVEDGNVSLQVLEGSLTVDGQPVAGGPVSFDSHGRTERMVLGHQSIIIVRRGERVGVRTFDNDSAQRAGFTGSRWFPIDDSLRVAATYEEFPAPRNLQVTNVIGDVSEFTAEGHYTFMLDGEPQHLISTGSGNRLFFVFRDATSGSETYGASRFLTADLPVAGRTILDFNRAYNPPCAFTPHATCPLPVSENVLQVPVRAGELVYQPEGDNVDTPLDGS
jgi:uncharacterized protein (DUF1684 family)